MNNNLTEIVFILDRSGSMQGLEADTIGGFNSMIAKQKKEEGDALISTILFNQESKVLYDRVPLDVIKPLTGKDYEAWGSTALIDAIGGAVKHISTVHKYARAEDIPAHTIFIITTDGKENASHHYSSEEVKKLITKKQELDKWEFLFLGANIDAVETAGNIGISPTNAVDYVCDKEGTELNYNVLSEAVSGIRRFSYLSDEWKADIEEDHKKRGRK